MKSRTDAWNLLTNWTQSESLRKHALAVEAIMQHYATLFSEDKNLWGNTGLLHDFDYEKHPQAPDHPQIGIQVLEKEGWPTEMIRAIGGHADYLNISRDSLLEKTLYAVDELSGLIMAVAYTRPSRTLAEVTPESVLKKMKQAGFAKAVNREDITRGCMALEIPLETHIQNCLTPMQSIAPELGL